MSIPRSVAQILSGHVTLGLEGIDRMYLNVYVPRKGSSTARHLKTMNGGATIYTGPSSLDRCCA